MLSVLLERGRGGPGMLGGEGDEVVEDVEEDCYDQEDIFRMKTRTLRGHLATAVRRLKA